MGGGKKKSLIKNKADEKACTSKSFKKFIKNITKIIFKMYLLEM